MRATVPVCVVEEQARVNAHFTASVPHWSEMYQRKNLAAFLYQQRRDLVLELADGLNLAPGSRILDVGCGPGVIAAALAERGYQVDAMDPNGPMVASARRLAEERGVGHRLQAYRGDIYALPYADETFSLVTLIGVADWLIHLDTPMREIARVLQPGGYLIANSNNCWALQHVLDPLANPLLEPLKRPVFALIAWLRRYARPRGCPRSTRQFERAIAEAGLEKLISRPLGFGPFAFLHWNFLPGEVGFAIHRKLQRLADENGPIVRSAAYTNMVVARKPKRD